MSASMLVYVILGAGFGLLAIGGEAFLRGAIGISRLLQMPSLLVGLLIVSVGGALPGLSLAVQAAMRGASDIAIASVVGGSIFTCLLAVGLTAMVRPLPGSPKVVFRDGGTMLVATLALAIIAVTGSVTRLAGCVLLAGFLIYLVISFFTDWRRPVPQSLAESRALARKDAPRPETSVILLLFGLSFMFLGGHFAVDGTIALARIERIPETTLGLTLVPAAIALPTLLAAIAAAIRGQANVLAGQFLSANVLNVLFVLGVTAVVFPLSVAASVAHVDVYVAVASAGVLVTMMLPGWRVTRLQGFLLFASYVLYLAFLGWRNGMFSV